MDVAISRLFSHNLSQHHCSSPLEIVQWMGALQAQDFEMWKWALGLRLPNIAKADVETAYNNGEIVRTHVLRPTWHVIPAEDAEWMIDLTGPCIKKGQHSNWTGRGLTSQIFDKASKVIEDAFASQDFISRDEIKNAVLEAGLSVEDNKLSHYLLMAELDKIICSGPIVNNKPTYALMRERIKNNKRLSEDEACQTLAERYFRSHGPATVHDFSWWSGLPVAVSRKALEMAGDVLTSFTENGRTYWGSKKLNLSSAHEQNSAVFMLPAFDEYVISYTDRSAIFDEHSKRKAISNNGMFWPVIIRNGKAIGTWKRRIRRNTVVIKPMFFTSPSTEITSSVKAVAVKFSNFLGLSLEWEEQ